MSAFSDMIHAGISGIRVLVKCVPHRASISALLKCCRSIYLPIYLSIIIYIHHRLSPTSSAVSPGLVPLVVE